MLSFPQTWGTLSTGGKVQAGQIGQDEQDKRESAIPATIATDLVVIHSQMLAVFSHLLQYAIGCQPPQPAGANTSAKVVLGSSRKRRSRTKCCPSSCPRCAPGETEPI